MTWVLLELSSHPLVQTRLRSELLEKYHDNNNKDIPYDILSSTNPQSGLLYLDAVIKETLRLHAPISEYLQEVSQFLLKCACDYNENLRVQCKKDYITTLSKH